MRGVKFFLRLLMVTPICLLGGVTDGVAQSFTHLCLTDGRTIGPARFSYVQRDGMYVRELAPGESLPPGEYREFPRKIVDYPRACESAIIKFGIHGSDTIGELLMPTLVEEFVRGRYGTQLKRIPRAAPSPGQFVMDLDIRDRLNKPVALIDLQARGSEFSALGLESGDAQIGMSSRKVEQHEIDNNLRRWNVNLGAPGNEHVLGLDGIAVIVNPANKVRRLKIEQIAQIFSGEISNWKDVAGLDEHGQEVPRWNMPIRVHARDANSGTFKYFRGEVLWRKQPHRNLTGSPAGRYPRNELVASAVANDPGAIGFTPGFARPAALGGNAAIEIGSECGIVAKAVKYTVKSEEYPLARRLYLYSLGEPSIPLARDILQFALDNAAQPVVIQSGFFDQTLEFQEAPDQQRWLDLLSSNPRFALSSGKPVMPEQVTRVIDTMMQTARRSTIVFRFEYGKADLDARARQDVGRLAQAWMARPSTWRRISLVGFTDSDGGWSDNYELGMARARSIAAELRSKAGVEIPDSRIFSMSYAAPVVCNTGVKAEQAKNRRVEVWITQ